MKCLNEKQKSLMKQDFLAVAIVNLVTLKVSAFFFPNEGTNGRPAIFPPNIWNHYELQVDRRLGRTNNAQEAFHGALNQRFHGSHPSLSKIITILKSEDKIATEKTRPFLLDSAMPLNIHPRKPAYIANDQAIHRLIHGYTQLQEPTDDQIIGFLYAVSYRLAKNNLNHWGD